MKKIEDLAAQKYISERSLPERKRTPAENYIDWAVFGAREAQRWISVEEELPTIGKVVLLKFDDDYTQITTGFLKNGSFVDDFGFNDEICTHWRPIERQ